MSKPENIAGREGHVIVDEFFVADEPGLLPYQQAWVAQNRITICSFARRTGRPRRSGRSAAA